MILRKTNPRHRQLPRLLMAVATGVLQLHLFFVIELHHHGAGSLLLQSNDRVQLGYYPVQDAVPTCPACQMARQGSVYPATRGSIPIRLDEVRVVSAISPVTFSYLQKEPPSGRAPPISS